MKVTNELRAEIRSRREPKVCMQGKQVPDSVMFIRELLATADDPHDRDDLLRELVVEYFRAGLEDDSLLVERERVANQPSDAMTWLALANSLSEREDGREEAKEAAATAVRISREFGSVIRHSLLGQARVARKTNDPNLFALTLRELIADAPNYREDDCELDDSVLRDLPDGFCLPELQDEYRQMLRQYGPREEDDGSTPRVGADRPRG